jgi:hypothetical protein
MLKPLAFFHDFFYNQVMNIGIGRQLEAFPKFLEGIADYKERLAAIDYFNQYEKSTDEERKIEFASLRAMMNPPYYHEDGISSDVRRLNNFVKFPLVSYQRSKTPDNRGRYVYTVSYMNSVQIQEYAQKVLDSNGEVLPSRDVKQAA